MCGIAGTTKPKIELSDQSILQSMSHRGPDAEAEYSGEGVNLWHTRLAIIDLDNRSAQPFWSEDKTVSVTFNGEIYNYKILREELRKDFNFRTTSDTEVLLCGYLKWGNGVWSKLEGMFAVSVLDTRSQKIILAKDHAGIKPLWYSLKGGFLSWASEPKTLFKIDRSLCSDEELSKEAMRLFFIFGYVPSPFSIFKNVRQLEKSTYLEFDLKSKRSLISRFTPTTEGSDKNIAETVEHSILNHLVADVPIGLFFSGGTDSSLIAAVLKKYGKNLLSYSLRMPGRDIDYEYSKKISEHLGFTVKYFDFDNKAFAESYQEVVESIDVPLADIAIFPTNYISKQASKDVKVVLSGEGGDELFFGYNRHLALRDSTYISAVKYCADIYLRLPNHKYKGYTYLSIVKHFDPVGYYLATCSPGFTSWDIQSLQRARDFFKKEPEPLYYDREMYLENMLLRKLDFSTMKHSIEGRVPLLANSLYKSSELAKKKFRSEKNSQLKTTLKNLLAEYIPPELVDRPKAGFGYRPQRFVENSDFVKTDFETAIKYLKKFDLNLPVSHTAALTKCPGMILPVILLYKSIINSQSIT